MITSVWKKAIRRNFLADVLRIQNYIVALLSGFLRFKQRDTSDGRRNP